MEPRHLYLCCHETPVFEVAASFSVLRFIASLKVRRGRDLCCLPMTGGASIATAWVAGRSADWIVYPDCESQARNTQFVLHQAAHVVLGHTGMALGSPELGFLLFPELEDTLALEVPSGADLPSGVASGAEERHAIALAREFAQCAEPTFDAGSGPNEPAA
jgi:hypothetical protein